MKNKRYKELRIKNFQVEKPYTERLADAVKRGQYTEDEGVFWANVFIKTLRNPNYKPDLYITRPKYKFGIKRWNGFDM